MIFCCCSLYILHYICLTLISLNKRMNLIYLLLLSTVVYSFSFQSTYKNKLHPVYSDRINNITQSELTAIKKVIQDAENTYTATQLTRIAKHIFTNLLDIYVGGVYLRWSTYVYGGQLKQVGISSQNNLYQKYLWLLNYGKYNLSYVIFSSNYAYCGSSYQYGGGSSTAQFGQDIKPADYEKIKNVFDSSITYKGDDIENAAPYIQDKLYSALKISNWDIVITDPTVSYGYYICRSYKQYWIALRSYKDLKWNYFCSLHY